MNDVFNTNSIVFATKQLSNCMGTNRPVSFFKGADVANIKHNRLIDKMKNLKNTTNIPRGGGGVGLEYKKGRGARRLA